MTDAEQLKSIIRHVKRVEDNCNLIAQYMLPRNFQFALELIQRGRIHDASKFDVYEFEHLRADLPNFIEALRIHHATNDHHPEYWEDEIHEMSEIALAEMVCDCVARGQEFGTDTRKWFSETATQKYDFEMNDDTGKKITKYLDIILNNPF